MAGSISGLRRQIPDFLLFSSGRQINLGEWAEFGDPHSSEENGKNGTTAVKKAVQNNEAAHKGGTGEPNKAVLAEIGRMLDRLIGLEGQQIM